MPVYKMDGKKDGKQKYRVRINYTDHFGKSHQIDRVAYGQSEAKQLERELNYKVKQELPSGSLTVGELYVEYMRAKRSEVRETSFEKSRRNLQRHVLGAFEKVKLEQLTVPVLQEWKNGVEESGLSSRTKKNIYSEFRAMLNWAVKMEYISSNPLLKVGNFKSPLESHKEMDYYTAEEFHRFISAARHIAEQTDELAQWHYYVFFAIAFYTGARKGEINALRWKDYTGQEISITKSLTQKLKGEDRITPPKNRSSIRTVQVPQPLRHILAEHRRRCEQIDGFSEELVICGGVKALRDTSLENANKRFAALAGVKKIRIHDFRHSHASLLANEGINIQEIARRLGHSDIKMTWQTYSHLYPREEDRAILILNKIV